VYCLSGLGRSGREVLQSAGGRECEMLDWMGRSWHEIHDWVGGNRARDTCLDWAGLGVTYLPGWVVEVGMLDQVAGIGRKIVSEWKEGYVCCLHVRVIGRGILEYEDDRA